jgi:esterase/lipase superfamily enzyme
MTTLKLTGARIASVGITLLLGYSILGERSQAQPVRDSARSENRSIGLSLDARTPRPRALTRSKSVEIFYITNRVVNESAAPRVVDNRPSAMIAWEDVFLNELSGEVSYGIAEIEYPSYHTKARGTHEDHSTQENPYRGFSIKQIEFISTAEAFLNELRFRGQHPQHSLLYVHGFNNSFGNAATRLGQLAVDLELKGRAILFSWPSDARPRLWLPQYPQVALDMVPRSKPYLAHAFDLQTSISPTPDVLAHSLGAELTTSMLSGSSLHRPWSLMLTAPDTSAATFKLSRGQFTQRNGKTTVYCSDDNVLLLSWGFHGFDDRLGRCSVFPDRIPGVDMVQITGRVSDFANHSYHLTAREMIDDLRGVLSDRSAAVPNWAQSGLVREIRIPNVSFPR